MHPTERQRIWRKRTRSRSELRIVRRRELPVGASGYHPEGHHSGWRLGYDLQKVARKDFAGYKGLLSTYKRCFITLYGGYASGRKENVQKMVRDEWQECVRRS